jgi:nudix-type nucleoside diphosphatase (YffH/AdpP family)
MTKSDISNRVRLHSLKPLSRNHFTLRHAVFAFQRRDGAWQEQARESYDIGDASTVLPIDRARDRVLLIRQFRWPPFESGHKQLLIETIAGKLDGETAETSIAREAMEEGGIVLSNLRLVTNCFVSPGAVKERVFCFLADYDSTAPREKGGGQEHEGEDIEVLEPTLDEALAMIASGDIIDMKTILLLQAAKLQS